MGDWYQTDWFASDWNSSQWFGEGGITSNVTFDAPLIEGVGTVGTAGVTGAGSVGITAPTLDGLAYHYSRGGARNKRTRVFQEEKILLEHWKQLREEEAAVLAAIRSFVHIEEVEWELSPIA